MSCYVILLMRNMTRGAFTPRKRVVYLLILTFTIFSLLIYTMSGGNIQKEEKIEQKILDMQARLQFLESLYRSRQHDVLTMQTKLLGEHKHLTSIAAVDRTSTSLSPEMQSLLKNITGSRAAAGLRNKQTLSLSSVFMPQLLPHLLDDPYSLTPAYHMKSDKKTFADVVIGIPTVKRDKESYLLITLTHLIEGLSEDDTNTTLIVVMVGETDLEYVITTARQIETLFPKQVETGVIELISPPASYYPDFDSLPLTLGDSKKRVKWRTKQNLDTIFLMAYAQSSGTFYLMLEDDVVAKNDYMQDIKFFTAQTTRSNPDWFFIEYCQIGGIGKLFRSADLVRFITYVQLFYNNLPIDWLLESYLADKVCTIDKTSKACGKNKEMIRPKYKTSLFQHIGLYSSLKGKMQKIKDSHFGTVPTYYPHSNPPLDSVKTTVQEHSEHTLQRAYEGNTYFWGIKPKKGNTMEFYFAKPTVIERYTFRSGNVEHVSDKIKDCAVEVMAVNGTFTQIDAFDEFGMADGRVPKEIGPLAAMRLRFLSDSAFWVILSEIELHPPEPDAS
ncbi:alpha-1,3-mannosyl-glycoprotein 4-beta-N-acetylglucosaminyltransferase A-like isoform X2 [Plodia interpunctella]|uniref:alpha-1,3-mannosyl-glycoprotein 4-beta-N-acetylglucosaminyltransferase A-like isoform X2 n=1 Tax=Plodia interpunctella TaxID=58824 RepID=UPI0023688B91|nr:alpha-1,3-mannosyl-glycoprotein 4-beta-N-acetylglucosaminyltransferase A-like isoform X2 [Plodia interpunctella]